MSSLLIDGKPTRFELLANRVVGRLSYVSARFRCSARAAIARSARRASLTDFESGNASANSGSSRTTLLPRRYWSVYLPRTPPEKSYSALIPAFVRLARGLFVFMSFMPRCFAGADYADPRSSHSMNHNQELPLAGHPDDHESFFGADLLGVRNRDGERITEDGTRISNSDDMFSPVRSFFLRIP